MWVWGPLQDVNCHLQTGSDWPICIQVGIKLGKPNLSIYQVRFTMKASPAHMIGLAWKPLGPQAQQVEQPHRPLGSKVFMRKKAHDPHKGTHSCDTNGIHIITFEHVFKRDRLVFKKLMVFFFLMKQGSNTLFCLERVWIFLIIFRHQSQ